MRGWKRYTLAVAVLMLAGTAATGCSSDGGGSGDENSITVWSLENLADRVEATKKIVADFTKESGVKVNYVAIDENQFNQLVTSAAAADKLPDVIGALPLSSLWSLQANELLDTGAAADTVKALGADTFSKRAVSLTRDGDKQLGVPSDAWAQLLFYRKDLFDSAGLAEPTTYAAITAAAQKLNTGGVAGITAATVPNDAFTAQTFEHLALGNGCEMVDKAGKIQLTSPACVNAFKFYGDLIPKSSVRGAQDVDTTRATYFAGKAAMVVWSSFLLDELAGLRNDALPNCPQCKADPTFLAKNTGVATAVQGPDGSAPAQYGEVVSWAYSATAKTAASKKFVQYMMGDGYERWLAQAPEGKFPTRLGTSGSPTAYADAWKKLPAGVDKKAPLSSIYPPAVLDALAKSVDTFSRWGITQGQGKLIGATLGELPVPKAVSALTSGQVDAEKAADQCQASVEAIKKSLE